MTTTATLSQPGKGPGTERTRTSAIHKNQQPKSIRLDRAERVFALLCTAFVTSCQLTQVAFPRGKCRDRLLSFANAHAAVWGASAAMMSAVADILDNHVTERTWAAMAKAGHHLEDPADSAGCWLDEVHPDIDRDAVSALIRDAHNQLDAFWKLHDRVSWDATTPGWAP